MPDNRPTAVAGNGAADRLERLVPAFDALVRDTRMGCRHARDYDELEQRAQELATELVAAFRRRTGSQRLVNPPIGRMGSGYFW